MMTLYSERQINKIREAGEVVAGAIELARGLCVPGATTKQINDAVDEYIRKEGGIPVFLGYTLPTLPPFPSAICASPNNVIIHGIPDDTPLVEGDILSVDVGVKKDHYIADGAWTFPIGEVADGTKRLLAAGEEALIAGIASAADCKTTMEIAQAIQSLVEGRGYSVVRDFCGHGVGHSLHEAPHVPNCVVGIRPVQLKRGMVFAIEPMVNEGGHEVSWPKDQWIVSTKDGKLSVHFEHTVAITENGLQVMTRKAGATPGGF